MIFNYRKVWVRSSEPYPISLTLKNLQDMLKDKSSMDRDCFNLVVRKIMSDHMQKVKKGRGLISKHFLDMQFWVCPLPISCTFIYLLFFNHISKHFIIFQMITYFGRHPHYRKKLDMEQLAYSVRSWPGMNYSVSSCKSVR